jgi:hypothetical protein
MGLLAPAFLAGLMAIAIPVVIHMIHRERRETLAFPSLMFLRKIPYRSVRRQKIRHILLLILRCVAIAIVVAAFARPFLERQFAPAAAGSDSRELVILLDRSYSMGHGGRWSRATDGARTAARGLRAIDRVSLVAFGSTAAQLVEPTSAAARFDAAVATLQPSSEPTRYGAGFRMAAQILGASDAARKEIVLISDFHRAGWTSRDGVTLPPRTVIRTVDVSRGESADVAVAHVAVARQREGSRARATVTARLTNLGPEARGVGASLELAGRTVQTRRVTVPPRGTAQVVFSPAPVAATTRGVVSITPDSQPANDNFYFTVSEEIGASVLIIEPPGARANQSLFLSRAWAVADDPPVRVDLKTISTYSDADLRGRSLIVLNETDLPAGARGVALRTQVEGGAMLLVVPGERGGGAAVTPEWSAFLPASIGAVVSRGEAAGGGRWASADFSNVLFEPFRAAGSGDFSSVAVSRYRTLTAANGGAVIARLDDGAPLLVERAAGSGRVLIWATSLDPQWTNAPFHALWVPLMHQLARRSLAGRETRPWFTAPHALELHRAGGTGPDPSLVVESPSGERFRAVEAERPTVDLKERGFYEVRDAGTAIGAGQPLAVNVDLAESDLSHVDAAELIASVTSREEPGGAAASGAVLPGTEQELERRQAIWWYLLLGALLVLAAETILSNRLSRQSARHPITGVS